MLSSAGTAPAFLESSATRSIDGADIAIRCGFDGRIAFLACAEESADVRSDGPILGCRFGWLDETGAQVADVIESDGRATLLKLEGIEPRPGSSTVFDVVADMDRPDHPAWLAELRVGDGLELSSAEC